MLEAALRHSGFDVHPAANGRDALDAVPDGAARPHRARRDAPRPRRLRGVQAAPQLAATARPVLFLTARDATEDKVRGLTLGGDDYLVKPFSLEELVARITAVLRRAGRRPGRRRAALRRPRDGRRRPPSSPEAGDEVALSPTEYNLLRYLLVNQGRVVSKAQILDHVWDYDFGGDGGVVETYIGYLRRKLDHDRAPPHPHDPRRRLHAARTAVARMSLRARLLLGMALIALVLGVGRGRHRPHHRGPPRRPGRRAAPQPPAPSCAALDPAARPADGQGADGPPPRLSDALRRARHGRPASSRTVYAPDLTGDDAPIPVVDADGDRARCATGRPSPSAAPTSDVRYRMLARRRGPARRHGRGRPPARRRRRRRASASSRSRSLAVLAVLAVLGLVTWWVLRLGVRPLRRMTATAGAIAAGDLSHRVPEATRRHRGRRPRRRPQRDARPHRGGVRPAHRVGGPPAPVRRRRLPRAAHAGHHDPRLRRALPHRRARRAPASSTRRCAAPSRSRCAWARSSTTCSSSPASTRAGRSSGRRSTSRALAADAVLRRAGGRRPTATVHVEAADPVVVAGRRGPPPPGRGQPRRQRARARARRADRGAGATPTADAAVLEVADDGPGHGAEPTPPGPSSASTGPTRPASRHQRRQRPRPGHRRGHGAGPRRHRHARQRARRRAPPSGRAAPR